MTDWQPTSSNEVLHLRAALLRKIRDFFASRGVLEVETPLVCRATVTDPYIASMRVDVDPALGSESRYLQTSPEFAMKRLLCAGSGPIFQICKAFRAGEMSRLHNPEFTLLEWYRPGFSLTDLMDETEALLAELLGLDTGLPRLSYRELFLQYLGFDPHIVDEIELAHRARQAIEIDSTGLDATDYLQLMMAQLIEPNLPGNCIVYDYPKAQAALARTGLDESGQEVAKRFELYCGRQELANAYLELTDAEELRRRMAMNQLVRKRNHQPEPAADEYLLAAMTSGLPDCAGIALGLDRLLLLQSGAENLSSVLSFDWRRS